MTKILYIKNLVLYMCVCVCMPGQGINFLKKIFKLVFTRPVLKNLIIAIILGWFSQTGYDFLNLIFYFKFTFKNKINKVATTIILHI